MQIDFDAVRDMNAIDGIVAELASHNSRPQGYPFSKVKVYAIKPFLSHFMPEYEHHEASNVASMVKLDFKKAGKVFGSKVKEMQKDLSIVPAEYLTIAERFPLTDEPTRKTTRCRKYLVEVESNDLPELWAAILFKKAVKEYITETLKLSITPCVFGDKYPDKNPDTVIPRVWVHFVDGPETTYQALEVYGADVFADTPIRLRLRTRKEIYHNVPLPKGLPFKLDGCSLIIYWLGRAQ